MEIRVERRGGRAGDAEGVGMLSVGTSVVVGAGVSAFGESIGRVIESLEGGTSGSTETEGGVLGKVSSK